MATASIKVKRSAVAGRIPATTDLQLGEIAINTYDGVAYIKKNVNGTETVVNLGGTVELSQNLQNRYQYTATSNQTTFAAVYLAPFVDVFLNGVKLVAGVDYTATNGTSIVLATGATAGNILDIVAYTTYTANANYADFDNAIVVNALGYTPYNATNPSNYITLAQARSGISASGSLAYDSSTGVFSYTTPSTTGITEGTNLYFTDARARSALSASTGISYNSTTGAISSTITQYTDALARGAVSAAGSLSYNSTTGVFSYTTPTTSGISEGTNLYFTDARARAALSASTGISYNSSTGAISSTITQYTDALARGAISVTGSGSYDSTTGVITVTGGVTSVNTRTGAVTLTSSDVGLGSVENKSSATIRGELTSGNVTGALGFTPENSANRGVANGYASLNSSGQIPSGQLPSYVDDVLEAANLASFPTTGETGKIYVALDTNKTYRWSGSAYVYITSGAVDSVAGKTGVVTLTNSDVGLGSVENKSSAAIRGEITSSNVTTALGFTPYNATNPNGYITGITSSNVTTALGFTPYSAANPSGYITSAALGSYLPLAGGTLTGALNGTTVATTGNIAVGTTLSTFISGWYALEVGKNASIQTTTADNLFVGFNSVFNSAGYVNKTANQASGGFFFGTDGSASIRYAAAQTAVGTAISFTTPFTFVGATGAFNASGAITQNGNQVLHAGNYTSYSPSLTGSGASGTWGISISGTAERTKGVSTSDPFIGTGGLWVTSATGLNIARNGTAYLGLDAGNYTSYVNPKGGGWYGSGLPGSRWGGYSVSGGEISFGDGLPNAGQMGILVDGCYVAGENNGFWSMGSDNTWGSRRGMYWDGTYLNFTTNSATAYFTNALIGGNQIFHASNYTGYNGIVRALGAPSSSNDWNSLGNTYANSIIQVDPSNFSSTSNGPTAASYTYGTLLNFATNASSQSQIFISHAGNDLIFRGGWNGNSWQTWNKVLTNQNYNSYSPTLTGGNASGTWGINVTGTASGENLGTVTARSGYTGSAVTLASGANHYQGHFYYDSYDAAGNHYPHFTDGGNASGVKVNWRLYTGGTNSVTHYWGTDTAQFATKLESTVRIDAPIFYDRNDTAYYINPNGSSQVSGSNFYFGSKGQIYDDGNFHIDGRNSPVWINSLNNDVIYLNSQTSGHTVMGNSARSPIFYDSNDTGYYLNPNGGSLFSSLALNGDFRTAFVSGAGGSTFGASHYSMGKDIANGGWSHPHYSDLIIGYHTGIRIGAHYSGIRFYNNSPTTDANNDGNGDAGEALLMTIGGYVGTANHSDVYVNNHLFAGGSMRSPIFYDNNDTAYYCNPNSFSQLSYANFNASPNGRTLSLGGDETDRIINDPARSSLVINATLYPHLYINATANASNTNHGPVFSMTGVLTAGGYRRWGMGIANTNPDCFSWGYYDNETNPHYGVGGTFGYTATNSKMWLNTGGSLWTTGDMRSPIFYDSNDTAYYVDPNSSGTCFRGYGTVDSRVGFVSNGNPWGTANSAYFPNGITTAGGTNWVYGFTYIGNAPSNGSGHEFGSDGTMRSTGSHRASIYYEDSNTSYYADPNGMSSMFGVAIRGDNDSTGTSNQLFLWGAGNTTTSSIGFKASGGAFPNPTGNGDGYNTYFTMDSNGRGWVFRRGVGGSDFSSSFTSGWITNNGTWQSNGSMRAPIFYDSDDTAYYIDPSNGGFNLRGGSGNRLTYFTNDSGIIINNAEGSGSNVRVGAAWGLPGIYNGGNIHLMSEGSVVFRTQNIERGYMDSSANLFAYGSMRAPIFYDQNDTARYVDPNSESRLSTLRLSGGRLIINGGDPTIQFVDSDQRGAALHNNSNLFYILSSNGVGGESWSTNNGYWPFYIDLNSNDSTFGGSIWAAGNITAYSDVKLKENIQTIDSALEKVLKLRGVYYTLKRDETKTRKIGVVAQEVQEVLPEVVVLHKDIEDEEGTLAVDYGNISGLLIEGMKEQNQEVVDLKSKLNQQQSELDELKSLVKSLLASR